MQNTLGEIGRPNGSLAKVGAFSELSIACDISTSWDINLDEPCLSLLAPSIEFSQSDSSWITYLTSRTSFLLVICPQKATQSW